MAKKKIKAYWLLLLMLLTALAIWLEDHGPVFYRQVRLTRNGKTFTEFLKPTK